jgi:hypothetical protein
MHANRAIDVLITLSQGFDIGGIVGTDADTQKVPYPALTGSIESSVQGSVMGGKVKAIEVAMGIYEHKRAATYIV